MEKIHAGLSELIVIRKYCEIDPDKESICTEDKLRALAFKLIGKPFQIQPIMCYNESHLLIYDQPSSLLPPPFRHRRALRFRLIQQQINTMENINNTTPPIDAYNPT